MRKILAITSIFLLLVATAVGSGIIRHLPPEKSISDSHIADAGLSDPMIWGRGFVPDTPTVYIVFDDSYNDSNEVTERRLHTAMQYWYDTYGYSIGLGIIVNVIHGRNGCDDADRFTVNTLRAAANVPGTEILSHSYANIGGTGTDNNRLSMFGSNDRIRAIVDSKICLEDSLIPGCTVRAFNWPGGDWDDPAWMLCASIYDYSTGGYPGMASYVDDPVANRYSDDQGYSVAGDFGYCVLRQEASHIMQWDTLRINVADDGIQHSQMFYDCNIIRPGAGNNYYHLPSGVAYNSDNTGTVRSFTEAKRFVNFIQHLNGAGGIYLHTYANAAWLDTLFEWLDTEESNGKIRVRTPGWVYDNYIAKPLQPGVNLNPYPHFATRRGGYPYATYYDDTNNVPGGLPVGCSALFLNSDIHTHAPNTFTYYDSTENCGYDGNDQCWRIYTAGTLRRFSFPVQVPRGSMLYASFMFSNYGLFDATDSSEVACIITPVANNFNAPLTNPHAAGVAPDMYNGAISYYNNGPHEVPMAGFLDVNSGEGYSGNASDPTSFRANNLGHVAFNASTHPMQARRAISNIDRWYNCRDKKVLPTGFGIVSIIIYDFTLGGASFNDASGSAGVKFDEFYFGYLPPPSGAYRGR